MTFPNGPFGQGFPGQPDYQPPAYTQQPLPPLLGQQPGYPGQQPPPRASGEPSGVTGMIAAVLAVLGGVSGLGTGVIGAFGLVALGSLRHVTGGTYALVVVAMLLGVAFGLALFVGAILLFQRKMIGRWLVVGGCAAAIISGLVSFGVDAGLKSDYPEYAGTSAVGLISLVPPIATLVLALVPSTSEWIRAKQNPPAPQPYPPYPPYPGWS
ncbi:hypothetical protein [Mycolicibacterium fortuitum]